MSEVLIEDTDRFRKPAPVVELTPELIGQLQSLLDRVQKIASVSGLPWSREAAGGKPILRASKDTKGATIAYGTIGSWDEIDLAVAAVNTLPAFLSLQAKLDEKDVVIGRKDERIAKLETALNEVFDFLGGVDGASDMRDLLLADFLQRPPENSR